MPDTHLARRRRRAAARRSVPRHAALRRDGRQRDRRVGDRYLTVAVHAPHLELDGQHVVRDGLPVGLHRRTQLVVGVDAQAEPGTPTAATRMRRSSGRSSRRRRSLNERTRSRASPSRRTWRSMVTSSATAKPPLVATAQPVRGSSITCTWSVVKTTSSPSTSTAACPVPRCEPHRKLATGSLFEPWQAVVLEVQARLHRGSSMEDLT